MTRLAVFLPFALVACVATGDEGMYIVKNQAVSGDACLISASPDQPFLGRGFIWSKSTFGYFFTPLLQSRFVPLENDTDDISRTIQLRRADIKLQVVAVTSNGVTSQQSLSLDPFSSLFAGVLPPGGYASVGFDLITGPQLKQLDNMFGATDFQAEVVATTTVTGVVNGDTITSAEYVYPITVCNHCIEEVVGMCPFAATPSGSPCNRYQDGVIPCCMELDGSLTCPSRAL